MGKALAPMIVLPEKRPLLRICPDLAAEIGLVESVLLLQIEYLIRISAHEREGRLWTRQTLKQLHGIMPWWGKSTIGRAVVNLESRNLIIKGNFNKTAYDRSVWYSLNPEGFKELTSVTVTISQNGKSNVLELEMEDADMGNRTRPNGSTIPKIPEPIS